MALVSIQRGGAMYTTLLSVLSILAAGLVAGVFVGAVIALKDSVWR
jgi:hypothetical protein